MARTVIWLRMTYISTKPSTCTTWLMVWLVLIFSKHIHRKRKATQILSYLVLFFSYHIVPERKTIWTVLGSNPTRLLSKQAHYPLRHPLWFHMS